MKYMNLFPQFPSRPGFTNNLLTKYLPQTETIFVHYYGAYLVMKVLWFYAKETNNSEDISLFP